MKIDKAMEKLRKISQKEVNVSPISSHINLEPWKVSKINESPNYVVSKYLEPDEACLVKNRCVVKTMDAMDLDLYKVLRTQILHLTRPKGWNTLMITSSRPEEGKSLTSINLALTLAKAYNQTVLLVDCDLRKQKIYKYFGLPSEKGIVDYMLDGCPLKDLIIWPKIDNLTLISGGRTVEESAELLGSQRMKELVAEMKTRYKDRYIIFDTPPLLSGADAMTFSPLVDGIVMVVREGRTSMKEVKEAARLIPKEKFLGFVLNQSRIAKKNGYYRYDTE